MIDLGSYMIWIGEHPNSLWKIGGTVIAVQDNSSVVILHDGHYTHAFPSTSLRLLTKDDVTVAGCYLTLEPELLGGITDATI